MSEMLKSPNRNKKKKTLITFIAHVLWFLFLIEISFYTFDIAMSQMYFSHENSHILGYLSCLWKLFPGEMLHQKTFAFVWSQIEGNLKEKSLGIFLW